MSAAELYGDCFDQSVRIEVAWPFPMSPAPDGLLELFEDDPIDLPAELLALIENWDQDEKDDLFGLSSSYAHRDAFEELCGCAFRKGLFGWLGVAATPVITPHKDGNGGSLSWGHYYTKLIFGTSGEDLLRNALDWARERRDHDYGRAKADAA